LVPQAFSGQLSQSNAADDRVYTTASGRRRKRRELTLDIAVKNMFMGVAFLIISIALSRSIGSAWWFWMLIPAFSLMGKGVAQYMRLQEKKASFNEPQSFPDRVAQPPREVQRRNTGELMPPPPSVTEGTTRHLGVEAATRHLDASSDQK